LLTAGLPSFLAGRSRPDDEPDRRGVLPPYPPVNTRDDLPRVEDFTRNNKSVDASSVSPSSAPQQHKVNISCLDIRVGVITKAWVHPDADKLFCEEIDIGEDEPRQIASGLRQHYNLDELVGKRVLVVANLKARKLAGFNSHGMVLCASSPSGEEGSAPLIVRFVEPPHDAKIGERVVVDGCEGAPGSESQVAKKKVLESVFPYLRTDGDGVASYNGLPLSTSAGRCTCLALPNSAIS
jgi:aminoacyl tRNA synthase complex-interacting multifunctional protein 1